VIERVVLVHGAWHGAWCWAAVVRDFTERGIPVTAVDLSSVNVATATLADDADAVRHALDAEATGALLVGHSYGGAVVTDAGVHPSVEHVVYLTAFALDAGESVVQNAVLGGEAMTLAEGLDFDSAGVVVRVKPERATEFFFHDCAPAAAADATARLRPQSLAAMSGVPRAVAWRDRPTTYIVCTEDRGIPVALQQNFAARSGAAVLELPRSHSPFLSAPAELTEVLAHLASA
jgi:pimeloyl-ACP methyl ester carboxylesterase